MKQVLVVEDNGHLRSAMAKVLRQEGCAVLTAGDGVRALQLIERGCPDLIVSDINMPRMDGYELKEAVQAHPEWLTAPFIFLTGGTQDALKGRSLGADDHFTKPLDLKELLAAVRACLERARLSVRPSSTARVL